MIRRFTLKGWKSLTYIQFNNDTESGIQYDYIENEDMWKPICQAHSRDKLWGKLESAVSHAQCIEVDENCVPISNFDREIFSVYDCL